MEGPRQRKCLNCGDPSHMLRECPKEVVCAQGAGLIPSLTPSVVIKSNPSPLGLHYLQSPRGGLHFEFRGIIHSAFSSRLVAAKFMPFSKLWSHRISPQECAAQKDLLKRISDNAFVHWGWCFRKFMHASPKLCLLPLLVNMKIFFVCQATCQVLSHCS